MPKEFPVGTIRDWSQGTVIKAHMPYPPFSNGWIPLKTSARFDQIGREADRTASDFIKNKVPINGEKVLDHEIDEFGDKLLNDKFFKADNFKIYEGFYGAGKYAFRNEFSKLFMKNDMSLAEAIAEALQEANDAAGGNKDNDKLSHEEKKAIRARVKAEFKEDNVLLTEENALQLLEIVKRTKEQVLEGLDFKDPHKKEVYEHFKLIADSLPVAYVPIAQKRKVKFEAIEEIEKEFADNWGVRESCKDYIQKKFDEYVRNYSEQIAQDSLEEQLKVFGVTVEMEPDEFYQKIYDKAAVRDWSFLEKYIGKEITILHYGQPKRVKLLQQPNRTGLYFKVTDYSYYIDLFEVLKSGREFKLSPEYDEMGSGFKDLIYLRFMTRYGKAVDGDWQLEHLPAIHNLENLMLELPEGHFRTNEQLNLITNRTYTGGNSGGYAWYSKNEQRINLSADCINRSTIWGVLQNPTEFKSVMLHEIGHAVDQKLGGSGTYNYKKFVVDCGWTYQQEELRAGMSATGDQKSIPRKGSNSGVSLITEYAGKSPSEAFAEYYSFYNLNKSKFDKFFETGDVKHLQTEKKTIAKSVSSEQTIREMIPYRTHIHNQSEDPNFKHWNTYIAIYEHLSDQGKDHTITLNNPWKMDLSVAEKKNYYPSSVKLRKDYSIHSMPPVVAVKDGLNRIIIDGATRQEVAKMNKQLLPTIEISKEQYYKLKENGLTDALIADCVYSQHRDDVVPKQIAPAVEITGLVYRDNLIPFDVVQENLHAVRTMATICKSKELQKAIEELFAKGIYVNDAENRKLGRVGQHYGEEHHEKNKTLMDSIMDVFTPYLDQLIERHRKSFEEENERPMTAYDEKMLRLTLMWDLTKAIGKYTKPTDKLLMARTVTGSKGSVEIFAMIERDGQKYHFMTEAIYAGGYNIQQLHFRYLTTTKLPKTNNTQEADKIKEKIQRLTKAEKIRNGITYRENLIKKYETEIATRQGKSDKEIIKEYYKDYPGLISVTWEQIKERGITSNFDNDEQKFNASQKQSRQQAIDSNQRRIHMTQLNIKDLQKEIEKQRKKLNEIQE